MVKNITIIGSGSWATAIGYILSKKGYDILLYCRRKEQAQIINKHHYNPDYLSDAKLPLNIKATSDVKEALNFSSMMIIAIPTQAIREFVKKASKTYFISENIHICNLSKGIEIKTSKRISEIMFETLNIEKSNYSVLSGPSHAEEVIKGKATAVVVASFDKEEALLWQNIFNSEHFRVYTSDDVVGVELGGAIKNIIAIGAGMLDHIKAGDNAKAAFITRGLAEMTRFAVKYGAKPQTLFGLAGIGDLMATCYSKHSRNRNLGELIASGYQLKEALNKLGMVAEGVYTTKALYLHKQKLNVQMPITEAIYKIIFEGENPCISLKKLMQRQPKPEFYP